MHKINTLIRNIVKSNIPPVALDIVHNMFLLFKKVIISFCILGYVLNIYHIFRLGVVKDITGEIMLKFAGVFIPFLGVVVGYFSY